ncbi:MAG TPA: WbqC family protein [Opitutaceae bacterium]|nr:WbqC family protein [Opitutaceae bacterium]HWB97247.1 WbqC family protein [Bryobacteraceae bacterium]
MKVVINQSNYLPWKGYFDLIHDADLFIFHDDLQYTKNDWRNRNKIKTARGAEWLTIPTGTREDRLICEVELPADDWARRHWRKLGESYRHAPYFSRYAPFFEKIYLKQNWRTLSDLNQAVIRAIAVDLLGIKTRFSDSRDYGLKQRKQDRVLELLAAVGAKTYLSGPAARDYLEPARFAAAGIELAWKDYSGYPEYPQPHPPFMHAVSIIDLLFSVGEAAPDYIWGWRGA